MTSKRFGAKLLIIAGIILPAITAQASLEDPPTVSVPEGGLTLAMLGLAMIGLVWLHKKIGK